MRRALAISLIASAVSASAISAQSGAVAAPTSASPEFEVASIKRNTSGAFGSARPALPPGEVRLTNVPLRVLVLLAYPLSTTPPQVLGLPSWAEDDRYDVIAKGTPSATPEEQQQKWAALLRDRSKLAAHYDTRELQTYNLVFARSDRALGAGITPSALDCSTPNARPALPPPQSPSDVRAYAMRRCNGFFVDRDGSSYSGGITLDALARMLSPYAGRTVIDRTGLSGYYALTLRFQRNAQPNAAPADDLPSLFTALPEQLGLKLESSKAAVQVLVVDHIERPAED